MSGCFILFMEVQFVDSFITLQYIFIILLQNVFFFQIKQYEKLECPDERRKLAREIYDNFIMKELLAHTHVSNIMLHYYDYKYIIIILYLLIYTYQTRNRQQVTCGKIKIKTTDKNNIKNT